MCAGYAMWSVLSFFHAHSLKHPLQPGHLVRDCPTKNAIGDTGGRKPKEGYVCRACGSELHYLEDCSTYKQQPKGAPKGKRGGPPRELARASLRLINIMLNYVSCS